MTTAHTANSAPDEMLRAMAQLMSYVVIFTRNAATDESFSRMELHDLMDAMHNVPDWMFRWDDQRQPDELRWFLQAYENKWPDGLKLTQMFESFYWRECHSWWSFSEKHSIQTERLEIEGFKKDVFLNWWTVDGKFVGETKTESGDVCVTTSQADSFDEMKQQAIQLHSLLYRDDDSTSGCSDSSE